MTEAPKRITANVTQISISVCALGSPEPDEYAGEYILATPEALAASPEVAKLIADAEARGMERAAGIAEHYRDMCGECHWPEEAVIVGGNVANDIAAAICREAMK